MFRKIFQIELRALTKADVATMPAESFPRALFCGRDVWRPFIGARLPPT